MRQVVESKDYAHKLHIRTKDDVYIKHFVDCVNQMTNHIYIETIDIRKVIDDTLREVEMLIRDINEGKTDVNELKGKLKHIHEFLLENKQKKSYPNSS